MPRETQVMDKTFKSYGSIGSYKAVSCDVGTPGYCRIHAGSLYPGSLPGIGFTQNGSSNSGEDLRVRMIGISKFYFAATQGSSPLGRPMYSRRGGRLSVLHVGAQGAGSVHFSMGICVDAEGTGSVGAFGQIKVDPQFMTGV